MPNFFIRDKQLSKLSFASSKMICTHTLSLVGRPRLILLKLSKISVVILYISYTSPTKCDVSVICVFFMTKGDYCVLEVYLRAEGVPVHAYNPPNIPPLLCSKSMGPNCLASSALYQILIGCFQIIGSC